MENSNKIKIENFDSMFTKQEEYSMAEMRADDILDG